MSDKNIWKYAIGVAPGYVVDGELISSAVGHIEVYRGFYQDGNKNLIDDQPIIKEDGFVSNGGGRYGGDYFEKWYTDEFYRAFGVFINAYETYQITYQPINLIENGAFISLAKVNTVFSISNTRELA